MNADCFTYTEEPYYYTNTLNLLGYSYQSLKSKRENNKYSRKEILKKHVNLKGKKDSKTKLELEDYLRNQLLNKYINKYKTKFNLDYFHFIGGVDETKDSVTIGSLDIKIVFPTSSFLSDNEYIAIECKRINKLKKTKRYYVDHGIKRFLERKYYPESESKVAIMLSFMECENKNHIENSSLIISSLNDLLNESYKESIIQSIGSEKNNFNLSYPLDIYNSKFIRIDNSTLQICHVFLDYYDLIEA